MLSVADLPQRYGTGQTSGLSFVISMTTQLREERNGISQKSTPAHGNISDALGIDLTIEDVQVRVPPALTKLDAEENETDFFTLQISKSNLERFVKRQ